MKTKFKHDTKFNTLEDVQARYLANDTRGIYKPGHYQGGKHPMERGRIAVWQARFVLFVMINPAHLWILAVRSKRLWLTNTNKFCRLSSRPQSAG